MGIDSDKPAQTTLPPEMTGLRGALQILHPCGTFAPTPASLITLRAIGSHQGRLAGIGLDWGSGTGCLAIAAATLGQVERVVGLEIGRANVAVARENARLNGVEAKVTFLLADSYHPVSATDRAMLESVAERVNFIIANPPSSEGDDGFGYRRVVLQGAPRFLVKKGIVFLSVSYQYGQQRIEGLCRDVPGFIYRGVLSSTGWVPFDLSRPDLLHCLRLYAAEERRGGLPYAFRLPEAQDEKSVNAQSALAHYQQTGASPLSKWQTHLFEH